MNLLSPFGVLWGGVSRLRNALYDRGILASHPLGARTISIGNLTAGGTGKTPIVALTAAILSDAGEKVCILSRGYARKDPKARVLVSDGKVILADAATAGDEPFELAERLLGRGVVVIADANRVAAAEWAHAYFGITAFVLDDAFQHRCAKRDVDIVCIDATNPWGGGRMLPAGRLREPISSLIRADAVVITRTEQSQNVSEIEARVRGVSREIGLFRSENRFSGMVRLDDLRQGDQDETVEMKPESFPEPFAFCGLGNPDSFFRQLSAAGFRLTGSETFPDHHCYSIDNVRAIERKAVASGAACLLTTAKDAVKLLNIEFSMPCYVMLLEVALPEIEKFRRLVVRRSVP
ncbi:MAG: tetraacyldisaccharide 4'-kinase [Pyrinomonadaceae bacterium]|nr:tetraacyldisaccharide 4'-kinase [Pyrinomonadaceae bacterium]